MIDFPFSSYILGLSVVDTIYWFTILRDDDNDDQDDGDACDDY